MSRNRSQRQPRMRVFAGPNGSGKSTVIESLRLYKANGKPIDLGYYINADDIARALRLKKGFSFRRFDVMVTDEEFQKVVGESGLLRSGFQWPILKLLITSKTTFYIAQKRKM